MVTIFWFRNLMGRQHSGYLNGFGKLIWKCFFQDYKVGVWLDSASSC